LHANYWVAFIIGLVRSWVKANGRAMRAPTVGADGNPPVQLICSFCGTIAIVPYKVLF